MHIDTYTYTLGTTSVLIKLAPQVSEKQKICTLCFLVSSLLLLFLPGFHYYYCHCYCCCCCCCILIVTLDICRPQNKSRY